jgi:hypothetical protein
MASEPEIKTFKLFYSSAEFFLAFSPYRKKTNITAKGLYNNTAELNNVGYGNCCGYTGRGFSVSFPAACNIFIRNESGFISIYSPRYRAF